MKKYISELISTFILVFLGCGVTVTLNALIAATGFQLPLAFTSLTIAFAFGAAYVLAYNSFGRLSGGHMNPAVSTAMLIVGKMKDVKEWAFYVIAQLAGGLLAAAALLMVTGQSASLGQNGYGYSSALQINVISGLIIEVVLTFIFVSLFLFMLPEKDENHGRGVRSIIIGLGLTVCYLVGLPFTGASLNPARSFGPAILVGDQAVRQLWLFIVAPLLGAAIAAVVYKVINKPEVEEASKEEPKVEEAQSPSKPSQPAKPSQTEEINRPEVASHLDYLNDELIKAIEEARAEERRLEEECKEL